MKVSISLDLSLHSTSSYVRMLFSRLAVTVSHALLVFLSDADDKKIASRTTHRLWASIAAATILMCHERRAYMACVRLLFLSIENLDELRLWEIYSTLA